MNLLITHAAIHTVDPRQPRATAMAIANDRIVAVGGDDEISGIRLPGARRIDLNGAFVLPGLIDAHLHLMWTGLGMQQVNVFEAPSIAFVVERVRARAHRTPPGDWILGDGWTQAVWATDRFPTAADLDPATSDHPVMLSAKSGHATWVNSAALQSCGITAHTPDPEGGRIVRDERGHPTGVLLESASALVGKHVPLPTPERRAEATRQAMAAMNRAGLTGVHCMDADGGVESFKTYQDLHSRGELTLRIVKQLPAHSLDQVIAAGIRSGFGDAWLRVGGIKIFADGALGPRTAAMLEPYEGEPGNQGIATIEREELTEMVVRCNQNGLAAVVHAIGDRANHDVLDAFEAGFGTSPRKPQPQSARREDGAVSASPAILRNRIEHAQIVHPDDFARFAQLGVIASMQPIHATQDMSMADAHWGRRSRSAYAWRSMRDAGARLAFGSDSPVETFDPLVGIHSAVTRRRRDGAPGPDGWYPEQRMTVEEAIEGFTIGAAYAGGMERDIGSLETGKLADLVVLSHDLTRIDPRDILDVKVQQVMVNGEWVVQA